MQRFGEMVPPGKGRHHNGRETTRVYSRRMGGISARVWWADPAGLQPWHFEILDRDERGRAARYRQDSDRASFVVAAALLRLVAGKELGIAPALVPVHRRCARCGRSHGRPEIIDAGFSVSVAHSAQRVMLGLSTDGIVGVDVEQVRALDLPPLRPIVMSPAELLTPQSLNEFFTSWVRKEAVLKALGTGLETPMSSITLGPADAAPRLVAIAGRARPDLVLTDVDAGPGYAAALATATALRPADAVGVTEPDVTVAVHRVEAAALLGVPAADRSAGEPAVRSILPAPDGCAVIKAGGMMRSTRALFA